MLVRFHAGGDEGSQLVASEMEEISQALALERKNQLEARWIDCVRTPGNRYRLFLSVSLGVFAQWNGGYVLHLWFTIVPKVEYKFVESTLLTRYISALVVWCHTT